MAPGVGVKNSWIKTLLRRWKEKQSSGLGWKAFRKEIKVCGSPEIKINKIKHNLEGLQPNITATEFVDLKRLCSDAGDGKIIMDTISS